MPKHFSEQPITDNELLDLIFTLRNYVRSDWKWIWAWAILLYAAGLSIGRIANSVGVSFWIATEWIDSYEKNRE